MLRKQIIVAACAALLTTACLSSSNLAVAQYRPIADQPHPDFALPQIGTDQPVRLSDYRGKKVLLVHFASW